MSDHSTFTFVFTDIEGSSALWEESPDRMALALARHDTLLHSIFSTHGGDVFKTMGDSVLVAFAESEPALSAAIQAQRALLAEEWETTRPLRVRAALHRGPAEHRNTDYFGPTLNRTSRLLSAGHGGQTLLSRAAREDVSLPDGVSMHDLGERRLRDLARPERIFQLNAPGLPSEFPPLRSLEVLPNNLPAQVTTFVGRERELEQAKRLIESSRLVTLTGSGGTGKTRLALQVGASLLESFADGVWLVELATVTDPALVAATMAAALGARENPERAIEESLIEFLRTKQLLLLLDNCEHLVAACAELAGRLLQGAPGLRILASSREALAIAGETTYAVPSLTVPDFFQRAGARPRTARSVGEFEAVRLFLERAAAVQPSFALTDENAGVIAQICWRLDGIPLAIELAAARVKMLAPDQILQRLDDRFHLLTGGGRTALPRQQTLGALIDWSHDLLSEKERAVLRRLAVFGRGRSLRAVEAVCSGGGVETWEILDLLQQLIDKSLVSVEQTGTGHARYFLLESVWEYARQKLTDSGEADRVRSIHLDYFLRLAEKAEEKLIGSEQVEWLEKMAAEDGNLGLALDFAEESPEAVVRGLRLAGALERYWEVRNYLIEGRERLVALLARPEAAAPTAARAKALAGAGRLAFCQDDDAVARVYLQQAIQLYRDLGLESDAMLLVGVLGFVEWSQGNREEARGHFEAAAAFGHRAADRKLLALGLNGLGSIFSDEGDFARARALKEESLARYRESGDKWIVGLLSLSLARVIIAQGDFAAARPLLAECASIGEELGNEWTVPYVLEHHGNIAVGEEKFGRAAQLYGASSTLRERLGLATLPPAERLAHERALAGMRAGLPGGEFDAAWSKGRGLSPDEALGLARRE